MDKKVCLVTPFHGPNYGTMLQATALSKYLITQGFDVSFLDSFFVLSYFVRHPSLLIRRIQKKLHYRESQRFFDPTPYDISEQRQKRLDDYIHANFNVISIRSSSQWKAIIKQNVTFVVGSDIVWQPAGGYPTRYFLDFAYHTKLNKISYGTSIGACELPEKYYDAYRKYLSVFSNISVREQAAADMMSKIIHRRIEKVVDPTLLLTASEWDELSQRAKVSVNITSKEYVLCYFVMDDPRYWNYVKEVTETTGFDVVVLPMHDGDERAPYHCVLDGTPYEFLWLIKNAALICTDSFHACVLSTLYQKEFYLLRRSRKAEDDKYNDFLGRYELKDRIVSDETSFHRKADIDYQFAHWQIEADREFSMQFLKNALQQNV